MGETIGGDTNMILTIVAYLMAHVEVKGSSNATAIIRLIVGIIAFVEDVLFIRLLWDLG